MIKIKINGTYYHLIKLDGKLTTLRGDIAGEYTICAIDKEGKHHTLNDFKQKERY